VLLFSGGVAYWLTRPAGQQNAPTTLTSYTDGTVGLNVQYPTTLQLETTQSTLSDGTVFVTLGFNKSDAAEPGQVAHATIAVQRWGPNLAAAPFSTQVDELLAKKLPGDEISLSPCKFPTRVQCLDGPLPNTTGWFLRGAKYIYVVTSSPTNTFQLDHEQIIGSMTFPSER
jgi:hypothetical protein